MSKAKPDIMKFINSPLAAYYLRKKHKKEAMLAEIDKKASNPMYWEEFPHNVVVKHIDSLLEHEDTIRYYCWLLMPAKKMKEKVPFRHKLLADFIKAMGYRDLFGGAKKKLCNYYFLPRMLEMYGDGYSLADVASACNIKHTMVAQDILKEYHANPAQWDAILSERWDEICESYKHETEGATNDA